MKKILCALFLTACVFGASAKNISNVIVNKKKSKVEVQKNTLVQPKVLIRAIDVTLSCGIHFTANFPNSWTTAQIINWVLWADNELCGGGGGA